MAAEQLVKPSKALLSGQLGRLQVSWLWEPRDCWVGIYWDMRVEPVVTDRARALADLGEDGMQFYDEGYGYWRHLECLVAYVSFLPLLPIKLTWIL